MTAFVSASGADLASGIPHQETVSLLEKLLIPLIHFILLGFLPIRRMRRSRLPSFAAGCGQLFIARAHAYHRCGGHAVIRDTLHDGLKLPRAFRVAGLKTDLFDATDLATCRMYRTAGEVWFGLAKNAGEALAAPAMIGPMTAVLLGGQVLPVILLLLGLCSWPKPWPTVANLHGSGCDHRDLFSSPGRGMALSPVSPGSHPPSSGDSHSAGHPVVCLPQQSPWPPLHLEGTALSHPRSTNETARPARTRADDVTPISCGTKLVRMALPSVNREKRMKE